ncbi:MAG: HPr family phosphocarrier protein [Chlamydiia bacterium]|nr:HPr family phosphocarrier protein [Chlamydiia bacterium]
MIYKAKGSFVVLNENGLHTRPSTEIVKCAAHFTSEIHLRYRGYVVNAKSILGLLMLTAKEGARIRVEVVGEDAEDALQALLALAQRKFNVIS